MKLSELRGTAVAAVSSMRRLPTRRELYIHVRDLHVQLAHQPRGLTEKNSKGRRRSDIDACLLVFQRALMPSSLMHVELPPSQPSPPLARVIRPDLYTLGMVSSGFSTRRPAGQRGPKCRSIAGQPLHPDQNIGRAQAARRRRAEARRLHLVRQEVS